MHGRDVLAGVLALLVLVPTSDAAEWQAGDFADPFVLREGDTYYAFATSARGQHVQVTRSNDLTTWTALPDALPQLPVWATQDATLTWAPSVLRREHGFVLYYTARDAASGFQCVSRATSTRPEGTYADDSARPFVCQPSLCGSIDPSPFVDAAGRAWLLWKSDENATACNTPSRIWSQPLSDDGLSVEGTPTALLTMDAPWERPLVEGPSMLRDGDATYLFYSGGWYESPGYAIGWARCDGPLGPCTKMTSREPLVKSFGATLGPGGQEFFTDTFGRTWMAYHAWTAPRATYASGGARSLRLARLGFADGAPIVAP